MAKKKTTNFANLISAINKTNDNALVEIYVPSKDRPVKFNPLTVQHQKDIITTALDNTLLNNTHYTILTSKIIAECCAEDIELLAIDRIPVLIGLRVNSLGYDVPTLDGNGDKVMYNIKSLYDKYQTYKLPQNFTKDKHVTVNGIDITIRIPTLEEDTTVNSNSLPIVSKHASDTDSIKYIVGEAIVFEYIKYIKSIEVGNEKITIDVDISGKLTKVIESLPMNVINELVKEINKTKLYIDQFTTIKTDKETLNIVTDARFFSSD